jgi:predicted short-subunit dehydrogenase-like oxidoreductase (DUF2520 family)
LAIQQKKNMRIAIIGAGNVATHLAKAFHNRGIKIDCIVSKRIKNARFLANQIDAQAFSNMKKYKNWGENDFVIIAVKDDAIDDVVKSGLLKSSNVLHTSGSYDSRKLENYCENFGSLYPFQTFRKTAVVDISEVPVFIEFSDKDKIKEVEELGNFLSDKVFELGSEARRKLHLSGVFINNFVYFILDKMKKYGAANEIDIKHLMPLLHQTIDNALQHEENLQTGPALRGDKQTMNDHLSLLDNDKVLKKLYITLSSMIYEESNGKEIEL